MIKKTKIFYERFAAKDFDESKMAKYVKHLTVEDMEIIKTIERRNADTLKKYPKELFLREHKKRIPNKILNKTSSPLKPYNFFKIIIPVAACLCIIWLGLFTLIQNNGQNYREKGKEQTTLHIYRQIPNGYEELLPLSTVREGDRLQFAFNSPGKKYGALFSIDGRKNLTLHFPDNMNAPLELPRKDDEADVLLPFSYTLDDAPDFERFFFLTSMKPFSLEKTIKSIIQSVNIKHDRFDNVGKIEIVTVLLLKGDPQE